MTPERPTYIYDLETYKDIFTFCIGDLDGNIGVLECSRRKNELQQIMGILAKIKNTNGTMVGFNNIGFDYPILHEILQHVTEEWLFPEMGDSVAKFVWDECQKIFSKDRGAFGIIPSKVMIHQTDLYLIHHFNNLARSTGLKQLEFVMRMENIEDLPYPPDCDMDDAMMDHLIEYNKHDVIATTDFLKETEKDIVFRNQLSLKYNKDFTNFNDTKIGKQIFIDTLEERNPGICYEMKGRRRVAKGTFRETLPLSEVIHPRIEFISIEMKAVLKWMNEQTLMSRYDREIKREVLITKDVFTTVDMLNDTSGLTSLILTNTSTQLINSCTGKVVYTYRNDGSEKRIIKETKAIEDAGCRADHEVIKKIAPNITATIKGFTYVFGLGGIHGSVENKFITADDEWTIMDIDVASYYPSLAIQMGIYPDHLGQDFCDIYKEMRTERLSYAKGTTENAALKLGLNGTYGDSNSKFSPLYDPAFTMKITLNGQLMLAMLAEQLVYQIEDLHMIQINTDGMTVKIKKAEGANMVAICKKWEASTGMELEYQPYRRMWVADVNNYIAEKPDGGLKLKGRYNDERDWSQNHSQLVIPKAAVAHLVYGDAILDFVSGHNDIYDYMMFAKAKGKQRLELWDDNDVAVRLQNNCRYYVTLVGGYLKRINPPLPAKPDAERPISLHSGHKVNICNNMNGVDHEALLNDIDENYYVEQVEKICYFEEM